MVVVVFVEIIVKHYQCLEKAISIKKIVYLF
jgi:hypothetical protein